MKKRLILLLTLLMATTGFCVAETTEPLPEGVVPITWDVSADHLMIEGFQHFDEVGIARAVHDTDRVSIVILSGKVFLKSAEYVFHVGRVRKT